MQCKCEYGSGILVRQPCPNAHDRPLCYHADVWTTRTRHLKTTVLRPRPVPVDAQWEDTSCKARDRPLTGTTGTIEKCQLVKSGQRNESSNTARILLDHECPVC